MSQQAKLTLSDLHEDAWMTVLQFLSLDNLLLKEKLFGISSRVFSTMLGHEIHEHNSDHQHDGGLFYRILNEKLISTQLDNCIKRINRNFLIYNPNDYDEETNSLTLQPLREKLAEVKRLRGGRGGFRGWRVRLQFFTRSRVNVEPSGVSMCKLRGELKQLVETCHAQFPHIYQERKFRIENSLRRSISVCTPVVFSELSNKDKEEGFSYHDNSGKKKNKPSIWNQSKREESIMIELKKPKLKYFKWRTQWSHIYRNHLLHELEYYITYLETTFKVIMMNRLCLELSPIHYVEALDSIYDTISKFSEEFQTKFLTERNFLVKKLKKRHGRAIYNAHEVVDRSQYKNLDFISHSTIGMVNICKHISERYENNVNRDVFQKRIDRNMTLHAKYFEHDLIREIICNKTIYHYLLKSADRDLIEKHFTQNVIDCLRVSPEPIQTSMVFSFLKASIPNFELLNNLQFSLTISLKSGSASLLEILLNHESLQYGDNFPLKDWLNFFIVRFGKNEVIELIKEHRTLDQFEMFAPVNYLEIANQVLGNVVSTSKRFSSFSFSGQNNQ